MNAELPSPASTDVFKVTKIDHWEPGTFIRARIPSSSAAEWLLIMTIYGLILGPIMAVLVTVVLQLAWGPDSLTFIEAILVCLPSASIIGALHLAGGDRSSGTLEVDWDRREIRIESARGARHVGFDELQAIVLRGEYYVRAGVTGYTRREKVYRARLDARSGSGDLLLLTTDDRQQHPDVATEELSPFAQQLAHALGVPLLEDAPAEEQHLGLLRAMICAPVWMKLGFFAVLLSTGTWIAWRAQPAASHQAARRQLHRKIEELGGQVSTRSDWMIGDENWGSVDVYSFEDLPIRDQDLISLGAGLASCERFELNLTSTQVTDRGLSALENNQGLVHLNLYGTRIGSRGLGKIARCSELVELNLNRTSIGDDALAALTQLPNLKCLRLWGTRVSDGGVVTLTKISGLRELHLNETDVTADGLARIQAALPKLKIAY